MNSKKRVNEELMKNLVNDLDKSLRDVGISDMSIGKYVKQYVKKFYFRLKILDPIFENENNEELLGYLNSLKFVLNKMQKDKVISNKNFYVFTGSTVGIVKILNKGLYTGKIDKLGSVKVKII